MEHSKYFSTLFLVVLIIATSGALSFCDGNEDVLCKENERQALVTFKQGLMDPMDRLSSWGGGDCCNWTGITCDKITGHVLQLGLSSYQLGGEINPSLLNLTYLNSMVLSSNDFEGTQIPKFIGSLKSLMYLDLSWSGFSGMVPHQLGNLTNLRRLDLSEYSYPLKVDNLQWMHGLTSLENLYMGGVNLSQAFDWWQSIGKLSSLEWLSFTKCDLDHILPLPSTTNLTSLSTLDLSGNHLLDSLWSIIENLTSIVRLDLSSNNLHWKIPKSSFENLCKLSELHLSDNSFGIEVSEVLSILSGCPVNSLERLFLGRNELSGQLPNELLGKFRNLVVLDLSSNSISGPIPESLGMLSHLQALFVSYNQLNGNLPESVGQLVELENLDISYNLLEGEVSDIHFANMTSLKSMYANRNSLTLKTSPTWVPPFQLYSLRLNSWNLGPEFPLWIQTQNVLSHLQISNTGVSSLPSWFKDFSAQLRYLNLSNNQLSGEFPVIISRRHSAFDLSSNQFSGSLPPISSISVQILDISNNLFSGSISSFLCDFNGGLNMSINWEGTMYSVLALGNNLLSGEIPRCWMNWNHLMALHLDNNNFVGAIPSSMGYLSNLRSLNLRNNSLSGELPSSLRNCTLLYNVDFSVNNFEGKLPIWIGTSISHMSALNLESNNFHGEIPSQLCNLQNLRILVLSHNKLSGEIPACFGNFTAMAMLQDLSDPTSLVFASGDWQFLENALLVSKGRQYEYGTLLKLVRSLDLSDNSLFGSIPEELTSLVRLQTLNLSMNHLVGQIPAKIGEMGSLETLDLSKNKLSGQLPPSIASLSFLSHLNVSCNELTGPIPTGTQLQLSDNSSFIGNQLCGPPLVRNCSESNDHLPPEAKVEDGEGSLFKQSGFYLSLGLGFAIGFWSLLGSLLINLPWSLACHRLLDITVLKLYNSIIAKYFY